MARLAFIRPSGIERGDLALVLEILASDQLGDLPAQPRSLPVVLELDLELDLAAGQRDHLGERGDPLAGELRGRLAAQVDVPRLGERDVRDPARVARQAHQVAVVEHDDDAVGGLLHVELGEVGPIVDRRLEGAQRVLGGAGASPRWATTTIGTRAANRPDTLQPR